jgi:TPR repeat protein
MKRMLSAALISFMMIIPLAACAQVDMARLRAQAEAGDPKAQTALGAAYLYGRGVTQNDVEAVKWLRKAAEQAQPLAQFDMGEIYRTGRGGVTPNDAEAVKWWQKSAEQGNAFAQGNLAHAYYTGFGGIEKNNVKAYMWNSLAEHQTHTADVDKRRAELESIMSPAEISEAKRLAQEWAQTHPHKE